MEKKHNTNFNNNDTNSNVFYQPLPTDMNLPVLNEEPREVRHLLQAKNENHRHADMSSACSMHSVVDCPPVIARRSSSDAEKEDGADKEDDADKEDFRQLISLLPVSHCLSSSLSFTVSSCPSNISSRFPSPNLCKQVQRRKSNSSSSSIVEVQVSVPFDGAPSKRHQSSPKLSESLIQRGSLTISNGTNRLKRAGTSRSLSSRYS